MQNFRNIKSEIRILAFDDGPFKKDNKSTILVGAVFRGGHFMDGVLKRDITVDGADAEKEIVAVVRQMKFKDVRVIMLDGITFAGFNSVNIKDIYKETKLPVIVVLRRKPDFDEFKKAISKLPHAEQRLACVDAAGEIYWVTVGKSRLAFQCAGIKSGDAGKIVAEACTRAAYPEPLRAAHLIAGGIVLGESSGRA